MLTNTERTAFLEVNSLQKYKKLFFSTFKLSACTFGGGFVIIPLMRKKFVEELGWIEDDEMMDLTAIAQSSPGAIAVNASILVGYHVAGFYGAILTVLGTVLPPYVRISALITLFLSQVLIFSIIALLDTDSSAILFSLSSSAF